MTDPLVEVWVHDTGLAFDGRVVELFRSTGGSERIHLLQFGYEVRGPDKRDVRTLLAGAQSKRGISGGVSMAVEGADWPAVEQLLRSIDAARR